MILIAGIMTKITYRQALQRGLQKPIRSKAYLKFVGSLPCTFCGHEPAGDITRVGTSDLLVFPTCKKCAGQLLDFSNDWMNVCMTIHRAITDGAIDL